MVDQNRESRSWRTKEPLGERIETWSDIIYILLITRQSLAWCGGDTHAIAELAPEAATSYLIRAIKEGRS